MVKPGIRFYRLLLVLVALGLLAALSVQSERCGLEKANATAVMLSDYRSLSDFSHQQGLPLDKVLRQVKAQGVSAIAVDELTRDDLQNSGEARLVSSYDIADLQTQGEVSADFTPRPNCVYLVVSGADKAEALYTNLRDSLGAKRVELVDANRRVLALDMDMRQAVLMGFGLPADIVSDLSENYGFKIWVRPWNSPFYNANSLVRAVKRLAQPGVVGVVFGGLRNEVLGFPNELQLVGEQLQKLGLKIGVIELPKLTQQKGIYSLARRYPQQAVRVLSVSPAQQAKLHPQAVAAMYCLGARERNIRLLYVRPYADSFDKLSAVEASDLLFATINNDLKGTLGDSPSVFGQPLVTDSGLNGFNFRLLFVALGIVSAFCAWLRAMCVWPPKYSAGILAVVLVITLVTSLTGVGATLWRLALALGGIMIFPLWGLVLLFPVIEKYTTYPGLARAIYAGVKILLIAAAFALVGGIMGASCLPDVTFMLSVDLFRGVKLHSLLVPVLVILCWIVFQNKRGALKRVRQLLNKEVRVWHLVIFVVLLGAMAFYLVRTGNAGGDLVVSDGERALRRWLDMVLGVRPRFKEFLLGNPCLVCLPILVMCRWRGVVPFALLAGAVGAASISGTYAHLHTPLFVSIQRTVMGVIVGGCLGALLSCGVYAIHCLWQRYVYPWLLGLENTGHDMECPK